MKGLQIIAMFCMLAPFQILMSQEPVISFNGQFEELPFTEFAESISSLVG